MDAEIVAALRETMWRRSEAEEKRFCDTIDAIQPPLSKELTSALFDTFLPLEDYGTQEAVVGTLTLATDQVYFEILGDKIGGIMARNPDYARDILVQAAREKPSLLAAAVSRNSEKTCDATLSFMRNHLSDEPAISSVVQMIEAKRT